jgi:hypothetical protein
MQSVSEGVENQLIDMTEGALTADELVFKCFTFSDAINGAMKELAALGGYPVDAPGAKPKK